MKGFLAADLHAFSARFPGIALDIELTDRFSDLARLEADVSIRMADDVAGEAIGRRLGQYAKTIYAAPDVAKRLDPSSGIGDEGPDWLGWPGADGGNAWSRATPCPRLNVRHNLPSHALQMEAAKAGMGLAMLPCFLGDREPGLVRVPGATPIPDRSIWLLLRAGLRTTARVRAFVDFTAAAILDRRPLLAGESTDRHKCAGVLIRSSRGPTLS